LDLNENVKLWNYSAVNENIPQYFSELKYIARTLEEIDQEITDNLKNKTQKQTNLTHSCSIGS